MRLQIRKYLILLSFAVGLTTLRAQLPDTLEMDVLLNLSQQNNINIDLAKLNLELANLDNKLVQAAFRPNLTANANLPNFASTSQEVRQPDGSIRFQKISNNNSSLGLSMRQNIAQTGGTLFVRSDLQRFDDFESDITQYNGVPIRVGFFQPIFGFNVLKWDRQLAPINLQEANKKYSSDIEFVNANATDLFFDLAIARTNLDIANSNFNSNESLYEIAQERHKLGKISDSDLLQLRVSLLNAQRSQKNAEQSVRLASSTIFAFLGLEYDGRMFNTELPEVDEVVAVDYTQALDEARKNRFEQTGFQRRLMEADQELARAKGEGGFQADLSASFGLTRSAMNVGEIYQNPQDEQFVQMTLSVPILDWGQQKSRVGIARAQQEFTQEQIKQERIRFETEIRQAVDQFVTVQEELAIARDLKELAQQRFDIATESFVLGAISITNLTIAQQEKDQSLRSYVFALQQYWQNYYLLRTLTLYDFKNQRKVN